MTVNCFNLVTREHCIISQKFFAFGIVHPIFDGMSRIWQCFLVEDAKLRAEFLAARTIAVMLAFEAAVLFLQAFAIYAQLTSCWHLVHWIFGVRDNKI